MFDRLSGKHPEPHFSRDHFILKCCLARFWVRMNSNSRAHDTNGDGFTTVALSCFLELYSLDVGEGGAMLTTVIQLCSSDSLRDSLYLDS